MKIKVLLITFAYFLSGALFSQIIHIPADYNTIQEGINASSDGDTVLVADGTFFENINFNGKAITLASNFIIDGDTNHISNTIIDGSQPILPELGSVVTFNSGEDTTSVLCGFTITKGSGTYYSALLTQYGGGIAFYNSGGKILFNKIINNHVTNPSNNAGGGGIGSALTMGEPWVIIENNTISDNSVSAGGSSAYAGGIDIVSNARIQGNKIKNNSCFNTSNLFDSGSYGGGVEIEDASANNIEVFLKDNIIKNNVAEGIFVYGAGILIYNTNSNLIGNEITYNSGSAVNTNYGGGLCIMDPLGDILIADNKILFNSITGDSTYGGGVCLYRTENADVLRNEVIYNTCSSNYKWLGAGISCVSPKGVTNFNGNVFTFNSGPVQPVGGGGGLWVSEALEKNVTINGNYFGKNTAYNGGGFFGRGCYNLSISNNIFSSNNSNLAGGIAIYQPEINSGFELLESNTYQPRIINNTFHSNSAISQGGAIRYQGYSNPPKILNCIFWANTAPLGLDIFNNSTQIIEVSYSNINVSLISGGPHTGEENINEDPLFISQDSLFHLAELSPCVNSGNLFFGFPVSDFDGEDRPDPLYNLIDMGADEFWDIPLAPVALQPDSICDDYFIAIWQKSILAQGYYLDVAFDVNFEDYVPGYEYLDVNIDTSKYVLNLESYNYYYRVKAYNALWTSPYSETISVIGLRVDNPYSQNSRFKIHNFPNPFSTSTTIEYEVTKPSSVQLTFYDYLGRLVDKMELQQQQGKHQIIWNAEGLQAGIYNCVLKIENGIQTTKLIKL